MARYFLGLDSSTQSLSAVVIDLDARELVFNDGVNFDEALPQYGTQNGTLNNDDPKVVHSPPLMWVDALDLVFEKMKAAGVPLGAVEAVAGSGQQHGSVYLNASVEEALGNLDAGKTLAENLAGCFSRETSPIWMDSSTTAECDEICEALGGLQATAEATGSTTFERFTGPQIRKFSKRDPEGYANTAHIALVSSFMASIMAGRIAPLDPGDGAGMNLMDIEEKLWFVPALEATAPGLDEKLPPLADSWSVIGPVSSYFAEKYGLNPEAKALAWSGDNPNSVVGLGLIEEGLVAISLGTSDTFFGTMKACKTDPRGEGHVFGSPTGDYMTLICFKNGSLAREKVKDAFSLSWEEFSAAIQNTVPGNGGKMMLPYFEPEIVPKVLEPGVRRKSLDESDVDGNCRAVVEAQMLSMRIHSAWMGVRPSKIYATGGASENDAILQVMADVHNCPVYCFEVTNSAALGAALRAAHGCLEDAGTPMDWDDIVAGFADPIETSRVEPNPDAVTVYDGMEEEFAAFEGEA